MASPSWRSAARSRRNSARFSSAPAPFASGRSGSRSPNDAPEPSRSAPVWSGSTSLSPTRRRAAGGRSTSGRPGAGGGALRKGRSRRWRRGPRAARERRRSERNRNWNFASRSRREASGWRRRTDGGPEGRGAPVSVSICRSAGRRGFAWDGEAPPPVSASRSRSGGGTGWSAPAASTTRAPRRSARWRSPTRGGPTRNGPRIPRAVRSNRVPGASRRRRVYLSRISFFESAKPGVRNW